MYEIGDMIDGEYYMKAVQLEVKGFLKKNTSIYYQGSIEYYLDRSILIPYPWKCTDVVSSDQNDMGFKEILYFAMMNSHIAVEDGLNALHENIGYASQQSGFSDYAVLGEESITEGRGIGKWCR